MIFPRPTIRVGRCLAIKQTHYCVPGERPRVKFQDEEWVAARLSYHLNKGQIPRKPAYGYKGQAGARIWTSDMVLHTCNHKWCIEPQHLYLGMHKENGIDRWNATTPSQRKAFKKKMGEVKMIRATTGIPKTEEHKRKISESHRRRKFA